MELQLLLNKVLPGFLLSDASKFLSAKTFAEELPLFAGELFCVWAHCIIVIEKVRVIINFFMVVVDYKIIPSGFTDRAITKMKFPIRIAGSKQVHSCSSSFHTPFKISLWLF